METNGVYSTSSGNYSLLGKKVPCGTQSFVAELEKQMASTKAKPEVGGSEKTFPHYDRLANTPESLCNKLEKIGIYVYEGWITKEQEGAMRSELNQLLQNDSLTAKDIGSKLESMNIDVIYTPKECLRENPMSDGIINDADWLPVDKDLFEEILKVSKE